MNERPRPEVGVAARAVAWGLAGVAAMALVLAVVEPRPVASDPAPEDGPPTATSPSTAEIVDPVAEEPDPFCTFGGECAPSGSRGGDTSDRGACPPERTCRTDDG